jgi:hypothetical protein
MVVLDFRGFARSAVIMKSHSFIGGTMEIEKETINTVKPVK